MSAMRLGQFELIDRIASGAWAKSGERPMSLRELRSP